jgi:phosphoribosylanthranilate isomerase
MIVQIYEIQSPDQAEAMIALGVDHIGSVILSAETWKDPQVKSTVSVVQDAGRKSSLIPLFDNRDGIARMIDHYRPDILHLCNTLPADESKRHSLESLVEAQRWVRTQFPEIDIMRSIPVAPNGFADLIPSVALARHFESCSDWLLIDTMLMDDPRRDQPVNGYVGITGRTCDWETARNLIDAVEIPVILAGGIGPGNAFDAVIAVRPAGIDSCTNTNCVDANGNPVRFCKDPDKVRSLMRAADRAGKHLRTLQPPPTSRQSTMN